MNRLIERRFLLSALLVAVGAAWVLAPGSAVAAKGQDATKIEGTLVAVDAAASNVTIRTQAGASRVVAVTAATKIERNGVRAPLSALKIGDRAQAKFDAAGATTKVESTGP